MDIGVAVLVPTFRTRTLVAAWSSSGEGYIRIVTEGTWEASFGSGKEGDESQSMMIVLSVQEVSLFQGKRSSEVV